MPLFKYTSCYYQYYTSPKRSMSNNFENTYKTNILKIYCAKKSPKKEPAEVEIIPFEKFVSFMN